MAVEENIHMNKEINELHGRVTGVERDVANVASQVSQLAQSVQNGFEHVNNALDQIQNSKQTNWQTWIGAGSFLLALVIAIGTLGMAPIASRTVSNLEAFEKHEDLEGHPTQVAQFHALKNEFDEYKLQQNRILLMTTQDLRRELSLRKELFLAKMNDLAEQNNRVEKRLEEHVAEENHPYGVINEITQVNGELKSILKLQENMSQRLENLEKTKITP